MSDQEAILLIYLFDSHHVFRQEVGKEDQDLEFKEMVKEYNFDLSIPLIGYAIGFPPIEPDIGGNYVQGDYDLKLDEEDEEYIKDSLPEDLED